MITEIPKSEFQDRIRRVQAELACRDLDALLTFGNEAEPQFVRYFSITGQPLRQAWRDPR
jgi:hypothetical protein